MSELLNHVTVNTCYGKCDGRWVDRPMQNTIVSGVWSEVFLNNLISQLYLRYSVNDFKLLLWSGNENDGYSDGGVYGVEYLSNAVAADCVEQTLTDFCDRCLDELSKRCTVDQCKFPLVMVISSLSDKFIRVGACNKIEDILNVCESKNAYLIVEFPMCDQFYDLSPMFTVSVISEYGSYSTFDTLVGVKETARLRRDTLGWVKVREGADRCVCVTPFYSMKRKKAIFNGKLLPAGVQFPYTRIRPWAIMQGILHEEGQE